MKNVNVAKIIKFPGLIYYYYYLLLKTIQAVNDEPALLVYYTLNPFTDLTLPFSFESQAHFMCYLYTLHIVLIKLYLKMQIAFIWTAHIHFLVNFKTVMTWCIQFKRNQRWAFVGQKLCFYVINMLIMWESPFMY